LDVLLPHLMGAVVERTAWGVRICARVKAEDGVCRPAVTGLAGSIAAMTAGWPMSRRLVSRSCCDYASAGFLWQRDLPGRDVRRAGLRLDRQACPPDFGCAALLEHIGLALASRTGSRLAAKLGLVASRGTLLGLVHALTDPEVGTVAVLGIQLRDRADASTRRY
jgi:hypothetical protein